MEIIGPFLPEHRVTIAGYHVPYITVRPLDDGRIDLLLDHRFGLDGPVSRDEFNRWIGIIADAMAIAAGYSCHGEHCTPKNPHKKKLSSLGSAAPILGVIDGGKPAASSPSLTETSKDSLHGKERSHKTRGT